ncbi:putative RDD family membrane protein YckC [Haloactinospora alba]|uniref:Putative RDD family membrane protein YckC n=1 Tax=Haloactinospora alba TaxID=405555 RepID=A0A543NFB3_9ACTN|nr:RDD family protein [Haloactinospora alba]TQN30440.1 putative RDD family membrane protein YckC [Haloactinospora alba]
MTHPGSHGYDEQTSLVTGEAVVLDLRPAGFATRMAALFCDVIVQLALLLGATFLTLWVSQGLDGAATAAVQIGLMVLILVGYPVAFETATRGRSLGKMALGLRVVGMDGSPERFRQALARALAAAVEIWTLSGILALLSSLANRDGRRVGDFLAGTLVTAERVPRPAEADVTMPPHLAAWAYTAELSQVGPDAAAMARQYVLRLGELTEESRHTLGSQVADVVARSVSPPPPPGTPPEDFLAAVLAERRRREEEKIAQRGSWR